MGQSVASLERQLWAEQTFRALLWGTQGPIQLYPGVFEALATLTLSVSVADVQQGPRGPGSITTAISCGARERHQEGAVCCCILILLASWPYPSQSLRHRTGTTSLWVGHKLVRGSKPRRSTVGPASCTYHYPYCLFAGYLAGKLLAS